MDEMNKLYVKMIEAGCIPAAPTEEVARMDQEVFEKGRCSGCGERVTYHSFTKGKRYRGFVVCGGCGYVEEV